MFHKNGFSIFTAETMMIFSQTASSLSPSPHRISLYLAELVFLLKHCTVHNAALSNSTTSAEQFMHALQ